MSTRRVVFLITIGAMIGLMCGMLNIPQTAMVVYLAIAVPVLRWSLGGIGVIQSTSTRSA